MEGRRLVFVLVGAAFAIFLLAHLYKSGQLGSSSSAEPFAERHAFKGHHSTLLDGDEFDFYPVRVASFDPSRLVFQCKNSPLQLGFFEDATESVVWNTLAAFASVGKKGVLC